VQSADGKFGSGCTNAPEEPLEGAGFGRIAYATIMSTRRSRPPRGRKSRNPEAPQSEIQVIVPPAAMAPDERSVQPRPDTPSDELAAIEAGWDELLA
jgi:hypothetical protein